MTTAVARCARLLADGGVAAIPTDTLYGLGASVRAPEAVARVLRIKTRDSGAGIPILVESAAQAGEFADMSPHARRLARAFWPGAVTLVLPARPGLDRRLLGPAGTVGVRVPASGVVRELVRRVGAPLTGTSANLHNQPPPMTAQAAADAVGTLVDLVLDGGPGAGAPSTVIDLVQDPPLILRAGAVDVATIRAIVPAVRPPGDPG
ncbi:MAG: L-threonylcarbamoyladenylate synthase [Chloroflexota bacterium]|nr:L-threonylcarbamoyladenylate synthase [Chloroflexota bacterium]MDE2920043.1 L-threonylcarbamoyladenylate synthase [Chloroflexota bacterium]